MERANKESKTRSQTFDSIAAMLGNSEKILKKTGMRADDLKSLREAVEKEDKENAMKAQRNQDKMKQSQIFNKSLINENLKNKDFSDYNAESEMQKRALSKVQEYVNRFDYRERGMKLVMFGEFGTGKSHLAAAAFKAIATKRFTDRNGYIYTPSAMFVTVPKLITVLTDAYKDGSRSEIISELSRVDLLVLDDLGRERVDNDRGTITSDLFDIIDGREGKHTIITSNLNPNELIERYDQALVSRIISSEDSFKMSFTWENYRLRGLQN